MNQLEKDVVNQIRRKLTLWAQDAIMLHQIADIDMPSTLSNITYELISLTIGLTKNTTTMTPDEFGGLCKEAYKQTQKHKSRSGE